MSAQGSDSVVFAIDTRQYSGNFEREMCAFITGQIGECGVGRNLATETLLNLSADKSANALEWIEEHIVQEPDDSDHPCYRPCAIWPTPNRVNNGFGQHFNEDEISPDTCWSGKYWPAYESVAIFFDDVPPKDVIDFMIDQAKSFAQNRPDHRPYMGEMKPLTLVGFRVLVPVVDKFRPVGHLEVAKYEA